MSRIRATGAAAVTAALVAGLAGCAGAGAPSPAPSGAEGDPDTAHVAFAASGGRSIAVDPMDASAASIAASQLIFASSELAFVATPASVASLADDAAAMQVPLIVDGPGAAGGVEAPIPGGDPRATAETTARVREHADHAVVALGASFGEGFAAQFAAASAYSDFPGGGQLALEGWMFIADYGHPGNPVLGVLGERDLDAAVAQVKERARRYEELTDRTVVPTFEIITTVASGALGDGDYSNERSAEELLPWVERAEREGIYVVLDLQPGNDTFLAQAQQYEALLARPNVGLALDPEWRLRPGTKHLEQIGTVTAAEVNETLDWIARLTAERGLPQKVVVLHQFMPSMITERETVDTSHSELALLVHVDGHGSPGDKMETWATMQEGLPEGIALGWKNFIDEDTPMFTPEQTAAIEPDPVFVSYQ